MKRHYYFGEQLLESFCIAFEKFFFGDSEIEKTNAMLYDNEAEDEDDDWDDDCDED